MSLDDFYALPRELQADVLNISEAELDAEVERRTRNGELPLHLTAAEREYLWAVLVCRGDQLASTPPPGAPSRTGGSASPRHYPPGSTPPGTSGSATSE